MSVHLPHDFKKTLQQLATKQGFQNVKISNADLNRQHQHYDQWVKQNFHGEMSYMARNVEKRFQPELLVPDTLSIICVQMDYLKQSSEQCIEYLDHPSKAYISRYALGRDYHKLIRKRLQKLAQEIQQIIGNFGYRVFTDSAPVMEKSLAAKAGLGWQGKHSNLLNREHGSWFFLGEIYTDLPLQPDKPVTNHCGECTACMDKCPTQAIVEPYVVDARKCISYLTIEHFSEIPVEFRKAIGNRIYGCDDCQLYCPWNRFEQISKEKDFDARHGLSDIELLDCFNWSEQQFLDRFEGSPIRRIGYQRWQRNLAVALGNASHNPHIIQSLEKVYSYSSDMVKLHVSWAIEQQKAKLS